MTKRAGERERARGLGGEGRARLPQEVRVITLSAEFKTVEKARHGRTAKMPLSLSSLRLIFARTRLMRTYNRHLLEPNDISCYRRPPEMRQLEEQMVKSGGRQVPNGTRRFLSSTCKR